MPSGIECLQLVLVCFRLRYTSNRKSKCLSTLQASPLSVLHHLGHMHSIPISPTGIDTTNSVQLASPISDTFLCPLKFPQCFPPYFNHIRQVLLMFFIFDKESGLMTKRHTHSSTWHSWDRSRLLPVTHVMFITAFHCVLQTLHSPMENLERFYLCIYWFMNVFTHQFVGWLILYKLLCYLLCDW